MTMWSEQFETRAVPIDTRSFRDALGAFPTGVCLVTTRTRSGKREALTISSFTSVSLNPPLILWSLIRTSPSAKAFREADFFAINVLGTDQRDVSAHFAKRAPDKFLAYAEQFTDGIGGVPLLNGCVARFECRNHFENYGGDHLIFVGGVERFSVSQGSPLVFAGGKYASLKTD